MAGVETRQGTKYVRFTVDVWFQEDDGHIHITAPDIPYFHTTVNDNPNSKRHHRNLFAKLSRVLKDHGKWPESAREKSPGA